MDENYLAKWLADEMTASELEAFRKTPEFAAYSKIKEVSGQFAAPVFDENAMYANIISGRNKKPKVVSLYNSVWMKIAAAIVILLGVGLVWKMTPVTQNAENGAMTTFELPDNSTVVLNAGSEIKYSKWNWNENRKLALSGEAYFRVAKGKTFEVDTKLGKVTVLGTQFNVKSRSDRFDVSCYEGRVQVVCGNSKVVITKGQSVSFAHGSAIEVPAVNVTRPEWIDNELMFNKETLTAILNELSRQYNLDFELKGPAPQQLFTGVLPRQNLDEALQIISATYHMKPVKTQNKIILEPVNVQK
ncbi:MAG TPA: FecR domain-containing protein [Flavobacterium sp.]